MDVFGAGGQLIKRLVSHGSLNSPWGLSLAGPNFGTFANALLVGNFGNGRINAYNFKTGAFLGQLQNAISKPLVIDGLWTITFGNQKAPLNTLFFSAGPDQESHGLFGKLQPVP